MHRKAYKFGISTTVDYSVPIDIQLRAIAEAGFDFISLGARMEHSHFLNPAAFRLVRDMAEKLELRIESAHFPFGSEHDLASADSRQAERALGNLLKFCERAEESGIDIVIVHPHDYFNDSKEACLNRAAEGLRRAIKALNSDIRIAIENLPGPGCSWIVAELLERFDQTMIGFCYDSSHENMSGEPFHILDRFYKRMVTSHLSDNYGRADEHLIPGDGTIDWRRLKRRFDMSDKLDHVLFEVGTGAALTVPLGHFLEQTIRSARNIFAADKEQ